MNINTEVPTNSIDDLMSLFGFERNKRYSKFTQIRVEAENAWLEGVNADANPFNKGTVEYWTWYETWKKCNVNC